MNEMSAFVRKTNLMLLLQDVDALVRKAHRDVRRRVLGWEGILAKPGDKYHGRLGVVDGISFEDDGGIHLLFMVYRRGTSEPLNGDGGSRTYRPLSEVKLIRPGRRRI